jgi:hypothetical protein
MNRPGDRTSNNDLIGHEQLPLLIEFGTETSDFLRRQIPGVAGNAPFEDFRSTNCERGGF